MARCGNCGAELPDYYTGCPNCGAPVTPVMPIPQASPTGGYAPTGEPRVITSTIGWLGWSMLCSFLPVIGAIIMMCLAKDPTAKNFGRLMLILNCIGLVLGLLFGMLLFRLIQSYF